MLDHRDFTLNSVGTAEPQVAPMVAEIEADIVT